MRVALSGYRGNTNPAQPTHSRASASARDMHMQHHLLASTSLYIGTSQPSQHGAPSRGKKREICLLPSTLVKAGTPPIHVVESPLGKH